MTLPAAGLRHETKRELQTFLQLSFLVIWIADY